MPLTKSLTITALSVAGLCLLTGCPQAASDRTSNQGGGNLITAGTKIANSRISSLTPDEIQVMTDKAASLNPQIAIPELTDEQAAAISEFLVANGIDSLQDVEDFAAQIEDDPNSIVIPDGLEDVFSSGAFGS